MPRWGPFAAFESRATSEGVDGVVVGIGLNCNRAAGVVGDGARATSIGATLGERIARADVAIRLFAELESALDRWEREGLSALLPELVVRLAFRGRRVSLDQVEGELLGIAEDGSLVLRTSHGVESFSAGRLTLTSDAATGG